MIDLLIVLATFGVIFANIWHHTIKLESDADGVLLVKNFAIAIGGVLILFWRWGYLS